MIYIVRHGQTDWNKIGKIQGHIDIELNKQGEEQALIVKEKLQNIRFDKVFSSPLKRAFKTAQLIYGGEIVLDDRLKERYNGELEGKIKNDIEVLPDFNDPNETMYNIEPLNNFKRRIKLFVEEILENYKNKDVLVVTHAGVGLYIRCLFEGEPKDGNFENYKLKNCDVLTYKN